VSPEDKQILIESMRNQRNPNPVVPDFAVKMLEDTCARTGLDWKLRHVYLIERGGKWQVTTSIDGFRLVANQDPEYAGQEGPFWTDSATGTWTDIPPAKQPYAAKIGIVRNKGGVLVTTWGVAKFADYDARSPMWTKMGPTMIAKCAEALGLRKALPGKLGGLYTIEEMEQAEPKAKAARNSKPSEVGEDNPDKGLRDNFKGSIEHCKTLDELKALGVEIQKSNLGLKAKQELSLLYNDKKGELNA
jgi:hypothetical protein